jgi:hypothetical protein
MPKHVALPAAMRAFLVLEILPGRRPAVNRMMPPHMPRYEQLAGVCDPTIVAVRRIHSDKGYLLRALLLGLWRALMARRFI